MPDIDLVTPPAAAIEFRKHQLCGRAVKMPLRTYLRIFGNFGPFAEPDSFRAFLRDCFDGTPNGTAQVFVVPERLRPELPLWFGCATKDWGYYHKERPPLDPCVRVEISKGWDMWFVAFELEWRTPAPKSWRDLPSLLNA